MTKSDYLLLGILVGAIMITAFGTYSIQKAIETGEYCAWAFPIPVLVPLYFLIGFAGGVCFERIATKLWRKKDLSFLTEFLEKEEERFIVQEILRKGCITQAEVTKKFGKVRAARAAAALEAKGIIKREKIGRTYLLVPGERIEKILE